MDTKPFITDFYSDVETVSTGFLSERGYDAKDIEEFLEGEFDDIEYPVRASHSTKEHMKSSFGLSTLVSEVLSEVADDSLFFEERAEDFRGFYEEIAYNSPRYGKNELIQFGNLYSRLAEEEDFDIDTYAAESLVLKRKEEVGEKVSEMMSNLADRYQPIFH